MYKGGNLCSAKFDKRHAVFLFIAGCKKNNMKVNQLNYFKVWGNRLYLNIFHQAKKFPVEFQFNITLLKETSRVDGKMLLDSYFYWL